jgi:hypothetical protein
MVACFVLSASCGITAMFLAEDEQRYSAMIVGGVFLIVALMLLFEAR